MSGDSPQNRVLSRFLHSTFGSDEFQAYTAAYSWEANQMAHAMMGFFLAVFFAWVAVPVSADRFPRWRSAIEGIRGAWAHYPWLRYVAPYLVPTAKLPFDAAVISLAHRTFPLHWPDFWHDKLTDLNFWFLGMLLAQAGIVMWVGRQQMSPTPLPSARSADEQVSPDDPNREPPPPRTGWVAGCRLERALLRLRLPLLWLLFAVSLFWVASAALRGAEVPATWLLCASVSGVVVAGRWGVQLLCWCARQLTWFWRWVRDGLRWARRQGPWLVSAPSSMVLFGCAAVRWLLWLAAVTVLLYAGLFLVLPALLLVWGLLFALPALLWPCRRAVCFLALLASAYLGFQHHRYWTEQKAIFDRSGLPSGWTRLCQYDLREVLPADGERRRVADRVNEYRLYVEAESPPRVIHCVIRGGWSVNRTDLAVALGTEFAARRKPVYYFTTAKLLEGKTGLARWKELAAPEGEWGSLASTHPFSPRCQIIDDVPNPQLFEVAVCGDQPMKKLSRVPTESKTGTYDPTTSMQNVLYEFYQTRNQVSTIWVLTCEETAAKKWLKLIREHACYQATGEGDHVKHSFGTAREQEARVIDIDLGADRPKRALTRGGP